MGISIIKKESKFDQGLQCACAWGLIIIIPNEGNKIAYSKKINNYAKMLDFHKSDHNINLFL